MSYHTPRELTPQAQGTGPCSHQDTAFQVCLQCPGHELGGNVAIVNIEIVTAPNNSPAMPVGLDAAASHVGRALSRLRRPPGPSFSKAQVHQSTNSSANGQISARIDQLINFPLSMALGKTETSQIRQNARSTSLCDNCTQYVV